MSLSVVKTINGVKQLVPLSGATPVDIVQDGNMNPVTSNAVFDVLLNKTDNEFLGGYDNVASSVEDAITRAFNAITTTNKTVTGYFSYVGIFMCLAFKYYDGQYGSMLVVRNDGVTWTLTYYTGTTVVKPIGADSYESTRYSATPNTSYVDISSTGDGVSVYKTKNGWKVLTGYFSTTNAVASGVNLFTLPLEVIQTRPAQLWVPVVSVNSGLTYLLLFEYNGLGSWGGLNPPANDILFIPPVTYL